jgi:hypothetical protein
MTQATTILTRAGGQLQFARLFEVKAWNDHMGGGIKYQMIAHNPQVGNFFLHSTRIQVLLKQLNAVGFSRRPSIRALNFESAY